MKAPLFFALPGIHHLPTGGNKYNRQILHVLEKKLKVTCYFPERGDRLPDRLPANSLILVDSLLVDRGSDIRMQHAGATMVLLLHYLEEFDTSKGGKGDPSMLFPFDGIITTSNYSREAVVDAGYSRSKIKVVYPGTERMFEPASRQSSAPGNALLTVANHLPGKGLYEFIDILEGLSSHDWIWTLIGDDTLDASYSQLVKERIALSSCSDRIRLLPACTGHELVQHYQQADLFVLPSFFETLSMAVREALRCGLPVVAYGVGGLPESVQDGTNGRLIKAYNTTSFTTVLEGLLANKLEREQLGQQASRRANAFPDWHDTGLSFLRALQGVGGLAGG